MAKKSKDPLPNLENATPEFLIDEIGRLRKEQSTAKKLEDLYKEALKGRARGLNETKFSGEHYDGEIVKINKWSLDTDAVKAHLGDKVEEFMKESSYEQINAKLKG